MGQEEWAAGPVGEAEMARGPWWTVAASRLEREDLAGRQCRLLVACATMLTLTPFPLVDAVQGDVLMLLRQPNQGEDDVELVPSQLGAVTLT